MNPSERGNRLLQLLPGLIISVLAIGLLVFTVDWRKTADEWGDAQLWVLVPALVCVLLAVLARAQAWRCLMGNKVPFGRCFWVLNIGYLLNGILPFRLGDVARAYLIGRRKKRIPPPVSSGSALSAVTLERMFDLLLTCILVLGVLPSIAGMQIGGRVLWIAFGLAFVLYVALFAASIVRSRIVKIAAGAAVKMPFLRPFVKPLDHYLHGLAQVRNMRRSVPAILWIALAIFLWAAEYWIVLRGFFPSASAYGGLLSWVGGSIGEAVPSSPSSLGVFENAVAFVLTKSGFLHDTAVAYAIALHMLNIVTLSALGALGLVVEHQSLTSVLAASESTLSPVPGD
jgi:uncharacterized protein (TIRG00374 family)